MRSRRRLLSVGLAVVLALGMAGETSAITWSPAKALTGSGTGYGYPGGLAAGSTTLVHGIYEQGILGNAGVYYRRSPDSGTTWSTAILLSRPSIGEAGAPVIEAAGNTIDAAWLESDDIVGGVDAVAVYRRSLDGGLTWKDPIVISPGLESAGFPRLARSGGRVEIVWTNEYTGSVFIRRSLDGGASWQPRANLGTTTMKPFGGTIREAYPTVAIGNGVTYVAWMSTARTLKLRRSTNSGTTWKTAVTLATNGQAAPPALVANGATALVGYGVRTSTDYWTVLRRTTNRGLHWAAALSLSPKTSTPSFAPVLSFRAGAYRAIYERCATNRCGSSSVYYRKSTTGGRTWGLASKVSAAGRKYHYPIDVELATKTIIMYGDYSTGPGDVFMRRGS